MTILPEGSRMVLPKSSRWFHLRGQEDSNREVEMVLPWNSRWFYLKGQDGSTRELAGFYGEFKMVILER
jgi:hypothetical protein